MQKTSHAFFNRIYVRLGLVAALVGGVPLISQAAYVNLSPPAGWNAGGSALWAPPANSFAAQTANQWINNAAKTSAMLNIGGKQIALEARLGLTPSAGRVMAAVIFNNPQVRTALGIATLLQTAKVFYDASKSSWMYRTDPGTGSDGYEYRANANASWSPSAFSACQAGIAFMMSSPANWSVKEVVFTGGKPSGCLLISKYESEGEYRFNLERKVSTIPGGSEEVPLTQEEMVQRLNADNHIGWPTTVPNELPRGTPLPVQLPVVNPSTGVDPFGRATFVPTGDPVKNPNYNPSKPQTVDNQPYLQPGVKITPRPTTANPWQVDVQPSDRPQAGPDPLPDTEQNPDAGENDKPREEDSKSLCEKHPDILACAKPELDEPDGDIPKTSRDVSLQEEGLFGGGACPADVYFAPNGLQQMKIWDWNKACGDISTYLKPILIICCTFAAFMILVPGRTE